MLALSSSFSPLIRGWLTTFKSVQTLPRTDGGVPEKLFFRILSNISFNHKDFTTQLNNSFSAFIHHVGNTVLDESIIACLDRRAPTVFIPRKPHPTGLRCYLLCLKLPLTNRAFCLQIIPDIDQEKVDGTTTVQSLFLQLKPENAWTTPLFADNRCVLLCE